MSVINKMLRDLDARQATEHDKATSARGPQSAQVGTASVRVGKPVLAEKRSILSWRWFLAMLLVCTLAGATWYVSQTGVIFNKPFAPAPSHVAQIAPLPLTPPAAPVAALAPEPVVVSANVETPVPEPQPVLKSALSAPNPSTNTVNNNAPIQLLLRLESALRTVPTSLASHAPVATQVNPNRAAGSASQSQPSQTSAASVSTQASERLSASAPTSLSLRQLAVQETLAQAQSLWTSGARSAALDLMREAVAVTERAQSGLTTEAAASVLASLVRELVRMELAEGRVSAVLEVLTRLEPALMGQSDLWAVRGNSAQRLGRHAESVRAYQMALKLRAGESRWMLGAAVSLAAQGQLTEAAELAEAARAIGTVSPEILAYLRQAGVALR